MTRLIAFSCFIICWGVFVPPLFGEEGEKEELPAFVLDEIVVTAERQEQEVREIPANVTVITKADIERSSAETIVDLLSAEGGLVQRGFLGNEKRANVDIRGMGETSVSNVLVLVDGIRLNPPDMAGPDFSTLSLEQVDRVEILHGAGSVLYGDGAVGGVINIITRPPGGRPQATIKGEAGSYETYEATGSAGGAFGELRLSAVGNYGDSDGYRDRGYFWDKNLNTNMAYDLGERWTLLGGLRLHKDRHGFPGPLTIEQFEEDPTQSTDPTDSYGETWEESYSAGVEAYFGDLGDFSATYNYRERENYWVLTLTPGRIDERTQEVNVKHRWDYTLGAYSNELTLGVDYIHTDYDQNTSFAVKPYEVNHGGGYFLDKFTLFERWTLQGGYRYHDYENTITTTDEKTDWKEDVYTVGSTYLFDVGHQASGSLFVNYATSFRIPNVDELGFSTGDLQPQTGRHWDVGVKCRLGKAAEMAVTWFYIRIEDEIWFDAFNYINTNYEEPTKRKGVETLLRLYPVEGIRLWGSFTYTDAYFEGADYDVPTVPKHKFVAGANWKIRPWLDLGATYNYVGSRPQGGNPLEDYYTSGSPSGGSAFESMPSYEVVDVKLTARFQKYGLKMSLSVRNLFDESYYTNSYYDNVYPSPERNYSVSLQWQY
jgi:iron complex outermembrane receptor protein